MNKAAIEAANTGQLFTKDLTQETPLPGYFRIVPRFFGVATFLLPASGMLSIIQLYKPIVPLGSESKWVNENLPTLYLIISLLFFGVLLNVDAFNVFYRFLKKIKSGRFIFNALCIFLAAVPILLLPLNYHLPYNQIYLVVGWTCYALLFAVVSSCRRELIADSTGGGVAKLLSDFSINRLVWFLVIVLSSLFICFVITNFCNMVFSWTYKISLSIALCAVLFYVCLATMLIYIGKLQGQNYFTFAVILFLILKSFRNPAYHDIETIKVPYQLKEAPSLESYITAWVEARNAERLKKGDSIYPIVLVNSYGGGIRAAAWTCLVMNHLDVISNGRFQEHVLSYSGASGGTVGSSIVCANGFNKYFNQIPLADRQAIYHDFFTKNDFFTPDLVGLLGNDAINCVSPLRLGQDRAAHQTDCWEQAYKEYFQKGIEDEASIYSSDFFALWNNKGKNPELKVPLLFSNCTEVGNGDKGIIAPFKQDSAFLGDLWFYNLLEQDAQQSIKLSTAAFLSARFPYISPAGTLSNETLPSHYFLDGGIKENSGAETSAQISRLLTKVLINKFLVDKMPLVFVSIRNSNIEATGQAAPISQIGAPLNGILNGGTTGSTQKADQMNATNHQNNYFLIYPQANEMLVTGKNFLGMKATTKVKPVLPLGWQLSDLAMSFLEKSIAENDSVMKLKTRHSLSALANAVTRSN